MNKWPNMTQAEYDAEEAAPDAEGPCVEISELDPKAPRRVGDMMSLDALFWHASMGNEAAREELLNRSRRSGREWVFDFEPFTCTLCDKHKSTKNTSRLAGGCVCDWYLDRMCEENPSETWADALARVYRFLSVADPECEQRREITAAAEREYDRGQHIEF